MVFKHHLTHGPKLLEGIACHMPLVERLSLCTFKKEKKHLITSCVKHTVLASNGENPLIFLVHFHHMQMWA